MFHRDCPNSATCGGELGFYWDLRDDGDNSVFMSDQSCNCVLTDAQIEAAETAAAAEYDVSECDPGVEVEP